MFKVIVAVLGIFLLNACAQHVNSSWEDGNLSKREHMERRLDRLESAQQNRVDDVLKKIVEPGW